jgi:hypothetical protein
MPLRLQPVDVPELGFDLTPAIVEFVEQRTAFHLSLPAARQAERHAMDAMELGAGILALAKAERAEKSRAL